MSVERSRRQVKLPSRYDDPDVVWDLDVAPRARRLVYKKLKKKDISLKLEGKEVYLFWPDDNKWYRGIVEEVDLDGMGLYIHYPDSGDYEDIGATELINEGHIAVVEERAFDAPLQPDDVPLDEADRATATYLPAAEANEAGSSSGAEDNNEEEERERRAERVRAAAARAAARLNGQVPRKRSVDEEGPDSASKRARGNSEVEAAEAFKAQLLGVVMGGLKGTRVSAAAQAAAAEQETRRRAREQLVAALQVAADELLREGLAQGAVAVPGDVGVAVEVALFQASGGLTRDYKAKFRSLVFNLKDVANPDLRARVLQGELMPDALVRLSTAELASRQLSAWRAKKSEEMDKAKFLDDEAAARFSTFAATELKAKRIEAIATQVGTRMLTTPDGPEGQEPKEEGWGAGNGADQDAGMEGVESEDLLGERRLSAGGSSGPLGDGVLLSPRGTADTVPAQAPPTPAGEGALLVHQLLAGLGQGGAATPADTAPATSLAAAPAPVRVSLPSVLGDPNPAPAAGGEGEDDAPYDPEGYNFSPSRGGAAAADTHTGMADGEYDPSGAHTAAGYDGGQDMGGPHVAHEPAEEEEAVKDLSPIVARPELGSRAAGLLPGELVWRGTIHAPDHGTTPCEVAHMGGAHDVGVLMGAASEYEVKGMLRVQKAEDYLSDIAARSKSRQVALGVMRAVVAGGDEGGDGGAPSPSPWARMARLYAHKQRAGVFHPGPGLEAYLLPPALLTRRLLLTARLAAPPAHVHLLPPDIAGGGEEMLVAVIYRRDWRPPHPTPALTAPPLSPLLVHAPSDTLPPPLPTPPHLASTPPAAATAAHPVMDPRQAMAHTHHHAHHHQQHHQDQHQHLDPRHQPSPTHQPSPSQQQQQQQQPPQQPPGQDPWQQQHPTPDPHASPAPHHPTHPIHPPQPSQPHQAPAPAAPPAPAPLLPDPSALSSLLATLAPTLAGGGAAGGDQAAPPLAPPQQQQQQQGAPGAPDAPAPAVLDPNALSALASALASAGVPVPQGAHHGGPPHPLQQQGAGVVKLQQLPDGSFRVMEGPGMSGPVPGTPPHAHHLPHPQGWGPPADDPYAHPQHPQQQWGGFPPPHPHDPAHHLQGPPPLSWGQPLPPPHPHYPPGAEPPGYGQPPPPGQGPPGAGGGPYLPPPQGHPGEAWPHPPPPGHEYDHPPPYGGPPPPHGYPHGDPCHAQPPPPHWDERGRGPPHHLHHPHHDRGRGRGGPRQMTASYAPEGGRGGGAGYEGGRGGGGRGWRGARGGGGDRGRR